MEWLYVIPREPNNVLARAINEPSRAELEILLILLTSWTELAR